MERDQIEITDLDNFMIFMRYNNYLEDEFGTIEGCDPPNNPAGSIANRMELYSGNCTFADKDWMVAASG